MSALSERQRVILDFLLDHPSGATLNDLVSHLGITKTAIKEHIVKLEALGYLSYTDVRGNVGRPQRRYKLTAEGQEVFPRQYSWLSTVLLELLAENMGASAVSKLMKDLAAKVATSMKFRFDGLESSRDTLKAVTSALNELGYRASLAQTDIRKGAVIEATNCVYHSVAKSHPELCQFDVQFIKNASGMDVRLEKCIAKGDSVCRFCLRNRDKS